MRITVRYFEPLKRKPNYFERNMDEMLEKSQSAHEFTNKFNGKVGK